MILKKNTKGHASAWHHARSLFSFWMSEFKKDETIESNSIIDEKEEEYNNNSIDDDDDDDIDDVDDQNGNQSEIDEDQLLTQFESSLRDNSLSQLIRVCSSLRKSTVPPTPSRNQELKWALKHIQDDSVERYAAQRDAASGKLAHFCLKIEKTNLYLYYYYFLEIFKVMLFGFFM